MRFFIQRVTHARVDVDGQTIGKIGKGYLVLIGVAKEDGREDADKLIKKMVNLRIFEDENRKTNLSLKDVGGEILLISQFTLYADASHGNRPSFIKAARPDQAEPMYEYIISETKKYGFHVETGQFGADMKVELLNDGPFSILLESNQGRLLES